jgi:hypothetical protein
MKIIIDKDELMDFIHENYNIKQRYCDFAEIDLTTPYFALCIVNTEVPLSEDAILSKVEYQNIKMEEK